MNTYPQQQQFMYKPNYQQWSSPMPLPQVRPVSSVEEVKASPIDFDGSIFYFPDIANKKIYTKNINMDGSVAINLYELKDITDQVNDSSYITRQEFEKAMKQLYEELSKSKEQEMSQPAAQQQPIFQF